MPSNPPQQNPASTSPPPPEFDPYHKWLGIPPGEQPPNHYRLLAIPLYEADLDVIEAAAAGRMAFVRQCATGPHAEASQKILNDLSAAEVCLLNADSKAAYDARLKVQLRDQAAAEPAPPAAADAKLQMRMRTLDQQKQQAESLLQRSDFASAIDILEKMAAQKNPRLARYADWANQQLPKARRGPQEMRESSAAVYRTAQELFDRHDYEEAAEILQQIPHKYRGPEMAVLLQECLDRQGEVALLLEDIERAEALGKYEDLMPTVKRLLKLKPSDRHARQLYKELNTYGKGGGGIRLGRRGAERFDAAGRTSNPLLAAAFVVVPLILFAAVSWWVYSYLRSPYKTIRIEIDDPTATVSIDGEPIELTGEGDTAKLKIGSHKLQVERDGAVLVNREFEVVKGSNPVLRISLDVAGGGPAIPDQYREPDPSSRTELAGTADGDAKPDPIPPDGDTTANRVEVDGPSRILKGHTGPVYAVTFTSDGKRLASCGHDVHARLWDVASGREVRRFEAGAGDIVFSAAFSPDDKQLALTGTEQNGHAVTLWDVDSGKQLAQFQGDAKLLQAVAYSPDGSNVSFGGTESTVHFWDPRTAQRIGDPLSISTSVISLDYSPDGSRLIVGTAGVVGIDVKTRKRAGTISGHTDFVLSAVFDRDAQRILSGAKDATVQLSSVQTGKVIQKFLGHTDMVGGVDFLPNERYVVSGSFDGTVRFWDTETGKEVDRYQSSTKKHGVRGLVVSPDGTLLATAGLDAQVRLWRLPESIGKETASAPTPPSATGDSLVCEKLEAKQAPTGLNPQAVTIETPVGDGRSGANGFLIEAPSGWEAKGTTWSCEFSRDGNSRGVIFIQPHAAGQVVVTVMPTSIHLDSPGQWPKRSRRHRAYSPLHEGILLKTTPDFARAFPLVETPRQLTSKLAADGAWEFLIDGKVIATAKVDSVRPLRFRSNVKFPRQPAKGTAGVIIGPTDKGSAKAMQIRLE